MSETAQLFFGNDQRSGDTALAGASPLAVNVLVDGSGAIRRRPGISAWSGFPSTIPEASEIVGIHSFAGDVYYVTNSRRIYRVVPEDATATDLSVAGATSFLAGTERPVFADTQWRIVVAGGTVLLKVDAAATAAASLGGTPADATQVAAIASRLVADDGTSATTIGRIRFSGTGDAGSETWDELRFTTAEARPDGIMALRSNNNELWAFGETTLQIFSPDPTLVLAPGRALNRGCHAPHSVVFDDESFAWLTEQRELVSSGDGRSVDVLSGPIAKTIGTIDTASDAWGFRWNDDQFDTLNWKFPTDGRTFSIQKEGGWSQWQGWSGGYVPFPATAHYYLREHDVHLVGLATGQIAQLDPSASTDLGGTIKAEALTGFLNFGTDAVKEIRCARFTFRRGHAGSTAPHALLSWRDSLGSWTGPVRLSLGVTGDHLFTVEKRGLGVTRARQWKLEFSGSADFVLARAEVEWSAGSN